MVKIALLGDIALFGKNSKLCNDSVQEYFARISKFLESFDYVIGNLETPFSLENKSFGYKSAYISTAPINIELLKTLSIDAVNLSNNHIYDFGKEGYQLTKKILLENGIKYFGIEDKQIILSKEGTNIALAGFCCYSTNPLGVGEGKINELDYKKVEKVLIDNKNNNLNSILSVHAGDEHINYPRYDHIKLARQLTNISPYVYYGHHPHVLQGIEFLNKSLLAYSLGNFCFDDVYKKGGEELIVRQSYNNKSSIILELVYHKNQLISFNPIPICALNNEIIVGDTNIQRRLNSYSKALSLDKEDYMKLRSKEFSKLLNKRTETRNLKYYLTRLNYKTLRIVIDLIVNKIKYNKKLKKYI
jgi:gamma-polyglutamate biosynthesis protein CapA